MTMEALLYKLAEDYNRRSELVALNREQVKEGTCDDGTLQWNRGVLNQTEDYLQMLAKEENVKLTFDRREHDFGFDDWKRKLTYNTVFLDFSTRNH